MDFRNGVKSIQAAAYNGARTVLDKYTGKVSAMNSYSVMKKKSN